MPLVAAERHQTAARPANPAPQPWQTQLIQAPALAPSRPHTLTHTYELTHTECKAHCHTHTYTRLLVNPQNVDFWLPCLLYFSFFDFFSHAPPSFLLSLLFIIHVSTLPPTFFHPSSPFKCAPHLHSWPPPSFFSSSLPPSSTAFLLLPWAPSRPGLGARLFIEAPLPEALSVYTQNPHICEWYRKSVESTEMVSCLKP